jgi:hypothetical protein
MFLVDAERLDIAVALGEAWLATVGF